MSIDAYRKGTNLRLLLNGAVALGNGAGSLRREVADALAAGARRIEVDISAVKYLDAAGLGTLVACRAMAHGAGARFMLVGVAGKPLELLRLTGLDRKLVRRAGWLEHPDGQRSVA